MNPFDPAYPTDEGKTPSGDYIWPTPGISLRDYIAVQALQGLLASESENNGIFYPEYLNPEGNLTPYKGPVNAPYPLHRTAEQRIAQQAFAIADAMIQHSQLSPTLP